MWKGQTSIEYLTTYGWMLFAVAVVSGGLLTTNIGSPCRNDVDMGIGGPLEVKDAGVTSNDKLKIMLQNADSERVTQKVKKVVLTDSTASEEIVLEMNREIPLGEKSVVELRNVTNADSCRNLELQITYDRGNVLLNQKVSGEMDAGIKIQEGYTETVEEDEPAEETGDGTETAEEAFYAVKLGETNSPVQEGNVLRANYTVENTGETEQEKTVYFDVDGALEDEKTLNVPPGEKEIRTFEYITSSNGTHSYTIETEDDSATGSFEVVKQENTYKTTVELYRKNGTTFKEDADIRVYESGSKIDEKTVSNGIATFELSQGDYSFNASSQGYYNASKTRSISSDSVVELEMVETPGVEWVNARDLGEPCNGMGCIFGASTSTAEYEFNWSVTDPAGTFQEVEIRMNSTSNLFGELRGTGSVSEDGGYGNVYRLVFRAIYNEKQICMEAYDESDQQDPGPFETC